MVFVIFSGFLDGFRCGFRWFSLVFVGWRWLPFGLQLFYRAFAAISAFWNTVSGPVFVILPGFLGHSGANMVAKTLIFVIFPVFLDILAPTWSPKRWILHPWPHLKGPKTSVKWRKPTRKRIRFRGAQFSLAFVHCRYFARIFDSFGGISRFATVLSARFSSFSRGSCKVLTT